MGMFKRLALLEAGLIVLWRLVLGNRRQGDAMEPVNHPRFPFLGYFAALLLLFFWDIPRWTLEDHVRSRGRRRE